MIEKKKYINVIKANKSKDVANFIPCKCLAERIQSIDIGPLYDINPLLMEGLDLEEIQEGKFRDLGAVYMRFHSARNEIFAISDSGQKPHSVMTELE